MAAGWLAGVSAEVLQYEALTTCVLLAVALAGTARFGIRAVFVVSLLAAVWLYAGDSLASVSGFGVVDYQIQQRMGVRPERWGWLGCSVIVALWSFILGLSPAWRGKAATA